MFMNEATTPYVPLKLEYGLMTRDEWLYVKNPTGHIFKKFNHHTDSIASLNSRSEIFPEYTFPMDYRVGPNRYLRIKDYDLIPVVKINSDGVYTSRRIDLNDIPEDIRFSPSDVTMVKRLVFQLPNELVSTLTHVNTFTIGGKRVTVYETDFGIVALVNNYIAAYAMSSSGRGTTLVVADEFRGTKLAKSVTDLHYTRFANVTSGGFTSDGRANSIRAWERRVRKMIANGWYTELIKRGEVTKERVREIIADLPKTTKKNVSQETSYLLGQDDYSMVIHTSNIRDEDDHIDVRSILAYGKIGFQRDYAIIDAATSRSSKYDKLCLQILLQLCFENNRPLMANSRVLPYIKAWFSDSVTIDGQMVTPTKNLINTGALGKSDVDMYDIKYNIDDMYEPAFID